MSRGFVKEGDQEDTPLVTPRVHLPPGATNYVTANGFAELKHEHNLLVEELKILGDQSSSEHRIRKNFLSAKLHLLEERIESAVVVDLTRQPHDEVHFGANVTLYKEEEDCNCHYQIVGVDEANIALHKVSFLSPIARVLLTKKVGDEVTLVTPKGERFMRIEAIDYAQA